MSTILSSLKSTNKQMESTNSKLSSGLKVSSALDDPVAYFKADNHSAAAESLTSLTDSMNESVETLNAADDGIVAIKELINDAKSLANSALSADDSTEAAGYFTEFKGILDQIDDLADDSGYGGINLLGGTSVTLTVTFDVKGDNTITLSGFDATATGLGLGSAYNASGWTTSSASDGIDDAVINSAISKLDSAKVTLRTKAKGFSTKLSTITARQDFTNSMVTTLNEGAQNLKNADLNTEGANLLSLQTQQQLGTNSLSIASQSMQSVLNLF